MPSGGTITVDPGILAVRVHVTKSADGTTPVVYNDSGLTSVCNLPVDIETSKTLYVTANGSYLVTVTEGPATIYSSVQTITGGGALAVDVAEEADPGYVLNDLADVTDAGTGASGAHLVFDGAAAWVVLDPAATEADTAAITALAVTGEGPTAVTGTAVTGVAAPASGDFNAAVADITALIAAVNKLITDDGNVITTANANRTDIGVVRTKQLALLTKLRAQHILAPLPS